MEKEMLNWIKEHRMEILFFNKNKNNPDLLSKYKGEIKKINSVISQLKNEFKGKREDFKTYIEQHNIFSNYTVDKYFDHTDRNAIAYMCVYELRRFGLKIDVIVGLSGWAINLRVLETQSNPELVKEQFLARLRDNNIKIIQNPQNPYTDEYHVTICEFDFDVSTEIIATEFFQLLKIFG